MAQVGQSRSPDILLLLTVLKKNMESVVMQSLLFLFSYWTKEDYK